MRIRTILLVVALASSVLWLQPRAVAAWRLHSAATAFADYAVCMVGPTGPALLRDASPEFRVLVRRRLLAATPDERVFEQCATKAGELTGSAVAEQAHRERARAFSEYALDAPATAGWGERTLDDLRVTTRPLSELGKKSWPFVRQGYTSLIRSSVNAREAVHPVGPSRPGLGRGLPRWRARYRAVRAAQGGLLLAVGRDANLSAYRSKNRGAAWSPISPYHPDVERFAERCPAPNGNRAFRFGLSNDASQTTVEYEAPDSVAHAVTLAPADREVLAAACDDDALVAAVHGAGGRGVSFVVCRYRQSCHPFSVSKSTWPSTLTFPLDLARIRGTTIVAWERQGVVRVTTSRDDGETWTPVSVAYDRAEVQSGGAYFEAPGHLLAAGDRVLLYAGSEQSNTDYLLLVSDDLGASFRTP